jgi:hypothetical protein
MGNKCDARWFFVDLGFSEGMRRAWAEAEKTDGQRLRRQMVKESNNSSLEQVGARGIQRYLPQVFSEV